MARQQPRRPQLVRITMIFGLVARQRHQPSLGLWRNRRLRARTRPVIQGGQRAIGKRSLDAAFDSLMMHTNLLPDSKERGGLTVREQHLRPLHPTHRLRSRARNNCEVLNFFVGHRQFDRLPPSCHVATPRMIKHKRGIHERAARFHYCPFHGIGRLVLRRLFAYVYAHGAGLVPCWASAMGTIVLLDLMGGVALLLWGLHMVRSGLLS